LAAAVALLLVLPCAWPQSAVPGAAAPVNSPAVGAPPAPAAPASAKPQIAGSDSLPTPVQTPAIPNMAQPGGVEVDRVVAVVNGDLILDSDVDQERRFAALLPYGEGGGVYDRDAAVERLINRELILEQIKLQPHDEISDEAARKDLDALRKDIPACAAYNCQTKAGWDRFLASQGFTEASLLELWKQRMEVLAFIEQRFRMGLRVTPAEIQAYYDGPLAQQFAEQHAQRPPLASISGRLQQIVLEQQVTGLLDDWLKSLRAQGSVVVLHGGESAP
jgi:hypothetical protein